MSQSGQHPQKRLLLVCRHSPYAGQLSHSALDFALAASVFEQDLSLLFMDDGVWQLLPDQQATSVGYKSIEKTLASLPLYDLELLHAELASLQQRQLVTTDLSTAVTTLDASELPSFLDAFDQIISC